MSKYLKKVITIIALLGITGMSAAYASVADSTQVSLPNIKPAVRPYLLAQGAINRSTGYVDTPTTTKQCTSGTEPYLSTSIIQTEINSVAAIQGIQNTLQLRTTDYHIIGALYMSNQVVGNSYASADWQIWCQPTKTA